MRLLSRTSRSVAPTEAGEGLLLRLRPALTDVQEVLDHLSGLRNKPAGRLRLLVLRLAGTELLAPKSRNLRVTIRTSCSIAPTFTRWKFEKRRKSLSVAVTGPLIVDDVEIVIGATIGFD